jgi:hypothetical protein
VFFSLTSDTALKSSFSLLSVLPISAAKVGKKYGLYFICADIFNVPPPVFSLGRTMVSFAFEGLTELRFASKKSSP